LPRAPCTIGLPVKRPLIGRAFSSTASIARYGGLDQVVNSASSEVIVTLEIFSTTTHQGLEQAKRTGLPLAVLVYELIATHPIYRIPPFKSIAREVARMDGLYICVSKKSAEHLCALGVSHRKVEVVSPGVDTDQFRPADASVERNGLIFVGRLAPHKGLPELLCAYEELARMRADLRLTVIGEGPLLGDVLALARRRSAVSYLGSLPSAAVAHELGRHAIFVAPAADTYKLGRHIGAEQFSFGVVEAMAAGLAIVTTDCGALPEVVPAPNPIIHQHDVQALAQAICSLLDDKERIADLQAANRDTAMTSFSLDIQARRLSEGLSCA
jgi:glycosyltransferase involved in cell wall biosynthesis